MITDDKEDVVLCTVNHLHVFLFDSYRGKENGRLMLYLLAASRKRNLVFSTICSKMLLYSFLIG